MTRVTEFGEVDHAGWTAGLVYSRFHHLSTDALLAVDGIRPTSGSTDTEGWWSGLFAPRYSVVRGLPPLQNKAYKIFWQVSPAAGVLFAESRNALKRLIGYELAGAFQPKLRMCRINVDTMVRQVMKSPSGKWNLSGVHARTPGEGSALRSISMYGSAITESLLLRRLSEELVFFACTLRQGTTDFAAVNGKGTIAVLRDGEKSLGSLRRVVQRLDEGGYLDRGVTTGQSKP